MSFKTADCFTMYRNWYVEIECFESHSIWMQLAQLAVSLKICNETVSFGDTVVVFTHQSTTQGLPICVCVCGGGWHFWLVSPEDSESYMTTWEVPIRRGVRSKISRSSKRRSSNYGGGGSGGEGYSVVQNRGHSWIFDNIFLILTASKPVLLHHR